MTQPPSEIRPGRTPTGGQALAGHLDFDPSEGLPFFGSESVLRHSLRGSVLCMANTRPHSRSRGEHEPSPSACRCGEAPYRVYAGRLLRQPSRS